MARDAAAVRFYRGLLWLYPPEFRDHFSREICLLLADRLHGRSAAQRAAVWLHAAAGVLIDAPKEHCHMIRQDLNYALRAMRREKLTTLIAVLVLALGIGSTATIFKLVNGLLLNPLPFPEQHRLVYVEEMSTRSGGIANSVAFPNYLDIQERNRSLESLALYTAGPVAMLRPGGDTERVPGAFGTGPLFRVLGVPPLLGRTFNDADDQPRAAPVVVLSEGLWRSHFGGDPAVLGKTVRLGIFSGPALCQVVGVMPRGFHFPDDAQLWLPLRADVRTEQRTDHWLHAIGRLRRGFTTEQAQMDLRSVMRQIVQEHPAETYGQTVNTTPFHARTTRNVRPALLTLMGAVGFVLLIACANISGLLLVRAAARQREIAIRGALGASRSRVVRQFVVESGLLGALGAAGGILMARLALPALLHLAPQRTLPVWANFATDLRTWAFILAVTLGTALAVGLLPALSASRLNLVDALKEGGRSSTMGLAGTRVRAGLVAAEVAMSVLLLAGAGLMIRTFLNLERQNLGYRTDNLTVLYTTAPRDRYPIGPAAAQLTTRISREFSALPGVTSVAAASDIPINDAWGRSFTVENDSIDTLREAPIVNHTVVMPGYFHTLGIPVLEGRDFDERDAASPMVAIIDAGLAKRYWPNQSPLGKRVRFGPPEDQEPWHTVVGVVAEVRNQQLRGVGRASAYIPYQESYSHSSLGWLVRTRPDFAQPGDALRQVMARIDRNIAVSDVSTLRQIVDESIWQERFFATMFAVFAALALLLALVGLYGVMAYTVSRRAHELGIRMALGASAGEIRRMVLLSSGRLVAAGLTAGLMSALLLTRFLEKQLYGVRPADPSTFAGVSALLAAAALIASYLPARRATRVDPMLALREE